MRRYLSLLIILTSLGCSNPRNSPLQLAVAFQEAIEIQDFEAAYELIDESLRDKTIPNDLEQFFQSNESVLTEQSSGTLLPIVAEYPTYRIIEFQRVQDDSCSVTDIVVVRNRDAVWNVVWADHLSSQADLGLSWAGGLSVHPLSTRNEFFKPGDYSSYYKRFKPSSIKSLARERFARRIRLKSFQYYFQAPTGLVSRAGEENFKISKVFGLPEEFKIAYAEMVVDELPCWSSDQDYDYDALLLASAQRLMLDNDVAFSEFRDLRRWAPNDASASKRLSETGMRWFYESQNWVLKKPNPMMSLYERSASWRELVLNKSTPEPLKAEAHRKHQQNLDADKYDYIAHVQSTFFSGRSPQLSDVMKATEFLSAVGDKGSQEFKVTWNRAQELMRQVSESEQSLSRSLTSSEKQICNQSFADLKSMFPEFQLENFCSCVFYSAAGFDMFRESPGSYLKENESCVKEFLFAPAGMNDAEIESFWAGVGKASRPVTREEFAASCAKGVVALPEFKDIDHSRVLEFCKCIYDEAKEEGLAMEELLTSAGDDLAEACGHLISR